MSVKIWLLIGVLLLSSCSTRKKERAFQKELDKSEEALPTVEVEAPPKLLEKFEVADIQEPQLPAVDLKVDQVSSNKVLRAPVRKNVPASIPAKIKSESTKLATPASAHVQLPKDYPAEMIELNSRAKKTWIHYCPNHRIGEKVFLDIHYLGMTVGKIMVTNRGKKIINGKEVWHFHARFKSAPFYSNIYELDDTVDTYVATDNFVSLRYSLIQRESKQDVDDLQLHDRDKLQTFWFYKQKKSDGTVRNKEKNGFIPALSIDPFSVLFFYQGLPLKNGDKYDIPIINKSKMLVLKSEVEGREVIDTEIGKKIKAIRVHATTKYTGETLKDGDMYFWFSDDGKHTLLKAQAKIKIGSVTADVVDIK